MLHGGPLDDTWWELPEVEPPRFLVPQEGLGDEAEPVLLANFPVPVGGWRYELMTSEDHRVVYLWGRDERPGMEFIAVMQDGPAKDYRMHVLGLTEPWPYVRLAPRPKLGPTDGGHMEWLHIPWPDGETWPGEVTYVLTGTLIPPRDGTPEAFYTTTEAPPWSMVSRSETE